jgi:hypothetical protein
MAYGFVCFTTGASVSVVVSERSVGRWRTVAAIEEVVVLRTRWPRLVFGGRERHPEGAG